MYLCWKAAAKRFCQIRRSALSEPGARDAQDRRQTCHCMIKAGEKAKARWRRKFVATEERGSQSGWNKSAGGAYYLAGGEPCIATDAGTSSPLGGNTARSAGRRYCRAERRHLQRRPGKVLSLQELMGRGPAGLPGRLPEQRARQMGACGETSTGWRRSG